ncbi:Pycsar system effector family protein [Sporosarcina limicola]|uniref:Pycsar effector protein domain-containing protein n=1 Tax=Sporosarcina limicola TaxID=34101 RepID=A0A927R4G1_9BACL|nr:Pycsar system effector family protein [Sporosarcina limicola]MBE1554853.1 hypothetical protein [Sporosarcina limicola]
MDTEKLLKQLDKNDHWIQNGDTKISIILTFLGVFCGYILAQEGIEELLNFREDIIYWISTVFFLLTVLFITLAIYSSLKGMRATISNRRRGLWFFGDVAKYHHSSHFSRQKQQQTNEQFNEELLIQIFNTAKIANDKFVFYNSSLKWTKFAVFSYLLFYVFKVFI